MTVYTVPDIGGPAGPAGPPGPATAAQQYGGIAIQGFIGSGNPGQALGVGWNKLVNFVANMPRSGVTPSFATSDLTIVTPGVYFVFIGLAWTYAPFGSMRISLFVNGVINLALVSGDKTFAFTPSNTCAQNYVTLAGGDVLDLRGARSAVGTIFAQSAQLYVERADP